MAAALAYLVGYAWPILDPGLPSNARAICTAATAIASALFAGDFIIRVGLAEQRPKYVLRHAHDLVVILLPLLRSLRLLRLITVVTILDRHAGSSLRGRVVIYVAGGASLLSALAALAMLDAERGSADANIRSFGDAVWWSLTTVTTVGYGDRYPVSTEGRVVAFGLMLAGIALLGVVTATLASWLVERVAAESRSDRAATAAQVEALTAEIRALRAVQSDVRGQVAVRDRSVEVASERLRERRRSPDVPGQETT